MPENPVHRAMWRSFRTAASSAMAGRIPSGSLMLLGAHRRYKNPERGWARGCSPPDFRRLRLPDALGSSVVPKPRFPSVSVLRLAARTVRASKPGRPERALDAPTLTAAVSDHVKRSQYLNKNMQERLVRCFPRKCRLRAAANSSGVLTCRPIRPLRACTARNHPRMDPCRILKNFTQKLSE